MLQDLRASGTAIVYISHRLEEIEALADRAVVLRDGRNAGVLDARRDHARSPRAADGRPRARVGVRVAAGRPSAAGDSRAGRRGCRSIACARRAIPDVEVSLTVNRGEVLGIAGLIGAGRSELAEAICGIGPRLSGRVLLDGQPLGDRLAARRDPQRASAWCRRIGAAAA